MYAGRRSILNNDLDPPEERKNKTKFNGQKIKKTIADCFRYISESRSFSVPDESLSRPDLMQPTEKSFCAADILPHVMRI